MSREEHPFAQYVRILGRGKSFQRSFTVEEADAAMTMVMDGQVRPEQLGAFLENISSPEHRTVGLHNILHFKPQLRSWCATTCVTCLVKSG